MNIEEYKTLREKVAGLLIVRISGHSQDQHRQYPKWELDNESLKKLIKEGLGGVIILGGNIYELQERCTELQKLTAKKLIFCADVEEGIGQRFDGGTWLPPPMTIGRIYKNEPKRAISLAEHYGHCVGEQARESGLNLVLAPICDVNTNPENPVINVRAWGSNPLTVSELTCAFQRGINREGVLTCAKHFPGHGDTQFDSHLELPILKHSLRRINKTELVPFKSIITKGVDSIMSAHIKFSNIDNEYPATLSYTILTKLLRQELNYKGLVLTDALIMRSIAEQYGPDEASVLAIKAGADLLLMPEEPFKAIEAICKAVEKGEITMERINQSTNRRAIALGKISNYWIQNQANSKQRVHYLNKHNEGEMLAKELIDSSLEIQNPGGIRSTDRGINLVRVDDSINCPILTSPSPALELPQKAGFQRLLVDKNRISPWQPKREDPLNLVHIGIAPTLVQLFIRGNPFTGLGHTKEPWIEALRQLQNNNLLAGVIIYGSPYLWERVVSVINTNIPAGYSPAQTREAQNQVLRKLICTKIFQNDIKDKLLEEFTD
ncbi:glycoside hydrolase family 3 N-terminal domain-containing protein [Prochlorococcus sp. MIT 1341]|uniref:glycoside hydrolase family 3 N-terminal domain-containing protein n=1 Tax=Prochlorococcus sp. MIT 1341 TaxID=3096221 RepID=UPI002A750C67|nr:glycoside hydrolase family 3 N-terminal domain-containing protein [Prochlorococcus sp. MIT 1341]